MKISLLMFLCLNFFKYSTFAQTRNLAGSVVDAKTFAPVAGVIVTVKGTKIGTTTNSAGEFTVSAPDNSVLIFSSIRFEEQEATPDISGVVNIKLVNNNQQQRDVVLVRNGIGTTRFLTGTGEKEVGDKPSAYRSAVLGSFASLQPRRYSNLQIKRATSTDGSEPTIIIDGICVPNLDASKYFKSAQIENVSYYKDVAGSSYGVRATGGLLLITTKREKSGNLITK